MLWSQIAPGRCWARGLHPPGSAPTRGVCRRPAAAPGWQRAFSSVKRSSISQSCAGGHPRDGATLSSAARSRPEHRIPRIRVSIRSCTTETFTEFPRAPQRGEEPSTAPGMSFLLSLALHCSYTGQKSTSLTCWRAGSVNKAMPQPIEM